MVKGIAKHAVIVKSPDGKQFEQAIFILSGDQADDSIRSADDMLAVAHTLASKYSSRPFSAASVGKRIWLPILSFVSGGAATAAIWWLTTVLQ